MKRLAGLASVVALVFTVGCAKTDAGITTNIKTKLAADDTVKAYQIDVDTQNHVVTLTGDVSTAAAKERAVLIARETNGVNEVIDHMAVGETAPTSGALDRARDETAALGDKVEQGADALKEESKKALNKTEDVAHQAAVAIGDAAITSAVKTKFIADPMVKALAIDVDTDGGVVTLTGTVMTPAEGRRAVMLAHETEGVKSVVNHLKVGR